MSIEVKIYNQKAEETGNLTLKDKVFGVKLNETLVHQAAVTQAANNRQVLAHTKTRAEVRGGGKKPWKQKGTGRARAGSSRSPIWIGGGVTFGPRKDRNFKRNINKKMSRKAVLMVLSDKVKSDNLIILDELSVPEYKTRVMDDMFKNLENKRKLLEIVASEKNPDKKKEKNPVRKSVKRSLLVVNCGKDEKAKYSIRNIKGIKIINLENMNILDLLTFRDLMMTREGIKKLEEKYSS
ncbi:50S ribosomal protein L4 [Candidatus Falkowbacteria bacterium RIFOXYB2_FULL_47_14]|uniref:Large ribosomal subunit protein uL4 n=1 Tax=Candidatus Falkowbacteria bacterium RIFOXYA2_FULL_47_19 TaxID=1797994 RepID=A0A1F5SIN4_9BACT|nr:MAG: 50S ribosomal protein L4 [Candidatus Falkowbacteria bacterium RIFOXYA2_FULL_47_19]OGF35459.1 MAG: 50S ribosomal protein L4 [Candidatus Falkowbacteria bacterium RIFOXYC2_FULL_46_15]OGF42549.1 MAG: 50S ribosomal protein L4 [Candidatus Falkowbacteria bacterium RIFOXYB2_FULL_47_14]